MVNHKLLTYYLWLTVNNRLMIAAKYGGSREKSYFTVSA
jgi:hypothetical protein